MEIVKTCKNHNNLTKEDISPKGKCKLCQREWSKNNYIKNREKILIRHTNNALIWRSNNKDKVKESNKRYWDKGVKEVCNNYVKDILKRKSCLKISEIPLDLVEAQRTIILIKNKIIEIEDGNS